MSMDEMIKVRLKAKVHRAGLRHDRVYDAEICRDNSRILIITDENGVEYGYSADESETEKKSENHTK